MAEIIDYFKRKYEKMKTAEVNKALYKSATEHYKNIKKEINPQELAVKYQQAIADLSPDLKNTLDKIDYILGKISSPNNSQKAHNTYTRELSVLLNSCRSNYDTITANHLQFDIVDGKLISYLSDNGNNFAFSYMNGNYLGAAVKASNQTLSNELKGRNDKFNINLEYIFNELGQLAQTKNNTTSTWFGSTSHDVTNTPISIIHDLSNFTLENGKLIDKVTMCPTEQSNIFEITFSKFTKVKSQDGYDMFIQDDTQPVFSALIDVNNYTKPSIVDKTVFYGNPILGHEQDSNATICFNEMVNDPEQINIVQEKLYAYTEQIRQNATAFKQILGIDPNVKIEFKLDRENTMTM